MKTRETLELFYVALIGEKSPATVRTYRDRLRTLGEALGDQPIETVTITDLRRWRQKELAQSTRYVDHSCRPPEPGGLSLTTVHGRVRAVRRFFRWLVEENVLTQSPADRLNLPRLPQGPPRAVSEAVIARMLQAAIGNDRDLAILCLLVDTGCRIAGVAGLRIADLNLVDRCALVREKGDRCRPVYYGAVTAQALARWLAMRPACDHDQVFTSKRNGKECDALGVRGVGRVLDDLAVRAGVGSETHNAHAFRHAWARRALRSGFDLSFVARALGHLDTSVTIKFYATYDDASFAEQVKRLEGVLPTAVLKP